MGQLHNPKLDVATGHAPWYPYYMGFSEAFVMSALERASCQDPQIVLDPWNGSGTTTNVATRLGLRSFGFDLNPVAVVVARGRTLTSVPNRELRWAARRIVSHSARQMDKPSVTRPEPLAVWLSPGSARIVRSLERAVNPVLGAGSQPAWPFQKPDIDSLSPMACFFYTAIFLAVRELLAPFRGSNPTWVRKPPTPSNRLRPTRQRVVDLFLSQVERLAGLTPFHPKSMSSVIADKAAIRCASSVALPLGDDAVDVLIGSPPYCTRIDYAVATQAELAVIGIGNNAQFNNLRRSLIGSTTISNPPPRPRAEWGRICHEFLDRVRTHSTRASDTYYYKNHLQYFALIYDSLLEIRRCVKADGTIFLVVQDSYYKEVHNPLQDIFIQMAESAGLANVDRVDHTRQHSMASINPRARRYRSFIKSTESVLVFGSNR